jgi:hypothetical protein
MDFVQNSTYHTHYLELYYYIILLLQFIDKKIEKIAKQIGYCKMKKSQNDCKNHNKINSLWIPLNMYVYNQF